MSWIRRWTSALAALGVLAPAPALVASPPERAREALAQHQARQWADSAKLYATVVEENPWEGRHWQHYGFALHQLGRYDQAIPAFTRSMELGFQPVTSMYNIACGHALLGRPDEALDWLERALDNGFASDDLLRTDTDLDAIRQHPRFAAIAGILPEGLSRDDGWRFDLDYLARRLRQVHYDLFVEMSPAEFEAALGDLKRRVPDLEDYEIYVAVQRILAMIGDGHTVLWPPPADRYEPTMYPLRFVLFTDGLFVESAAPALAETVGCRVRRIGTRSTDEAWAILEDYCSVDNEIGLRAAVPRFLRLPVFLKATGVAEDLTGVPLEVEKPDGETFTARLEAVPFDRDERGWVTARDGAESPAPLWLRHPGRPFWFEHVEDRKLVYMQFNVVRDQPDQTVSAFCDELFDFIDAHGVERLVIDMRLNGGGNNFLNQPLVHGLIRCDAVNRPGHLFVITGRMTFSAAMNGVADIDTHTRALFVGEATGSKPNFIGETTPISLSWSELTLSCSSLYWQRSHAFDYRTCIAPDLPAEMSSEDYRTNRDPAMEAVYEYLGER